MSIINFFKSLFGSSVNVVKTEPVQEIVQQYEPVQESVTAPDPTALTKLTKAALEQHAKDVYGVDLDRRKTKANMIDDLMSAVQ